MMKPLFDFALSLLTGLALHQTASYTHKMPYGWEKLAGTTIGVLGTAPIFALWSKRLETVPSPTGRGVMAYFLAFLGVGSGVALGWLIDVVFRIER